MSNMYATFLLNLLSIQVIYSDFYCDRLTLLAFLAIFILRFIIFLVSLGCIL